MKKIIINSLLLIGLFTTASCTKDYKDINKNTYGVTDEELAKSGVVGYGNSFLQMQQYVIPIGAPAKTTGPGNDLQVTDLISSGNYIGYFGNNNNWNFNIEAKLKIIILFAYDTLLAVFADARSCLFIGCEARVVRAYMISADSRLLRI